MKNRYLLYPLFLLLSPSLFAQFSQVIRATEVFHANDIRALIVNNGTLDYEATNYNGYPYAVPFTGKRSPGTINNYGLWIATMDGTELRMSLQYFSDIQSEFWPGPLHPVSGAPYSSADLVNYNRIWTVYHYDLERHLADFQDNGVLDDPVLAVIGWPGHGNPYFKYINNFDLPNTKDGLAPFFDRDGDGIYNAFNGDYPLPESVAPGVLPAQISWFINNDVSGPHQIANAAPLGIELQTTIWAFRSENEPLLNKSLFTSQKIINRSGRDYNDVRVGLWVDMSIGCWHDDYTGCFPHLNSYFAYNQGAYDDSSDHCTGLIPYEDELPVQAVTLLNQPLDGFQMFQWGWDEDLYIPPMAMTPPFETMDYYNYLHLRWKDGTRISRVGNGYDPGSTDHTNFIFPGNPNEPDEWSMYSEDLPQNNVFSLGVVKLEQFNNGASTVFDIAYSTHFDSLLNNIEVVNLLETEIPLIQDYYNSGFTGVETYDLCRLDCVWPGDANSDGIANQYDVLAIGGGYDSIGPVRDFPINWAPYEAEPWNQELVDGINYMHLDANGDGLIDNDDIETLKINYGRTSYWHLYDHRRKQGNDFYFKFSQQVENNIIGPEDSYFLVSVRHQDLPGFIGFAMTVEYDTSFLTLDDTYNNNLHNGCPSFLEGFTNKSVYNEAGGEVHYALLKKDYCYNFSNAVSFTMNFRPNDVLPGDKTFLRFRDIRGLLEGGGEVALGGKDEVLYFTGIEMEPADRDDPGITIFPNPSDGIFYFNVEREEVFEIRIYDAAGRLIDPQPEYRWQDFMVDMRNYPAGVYFLELYQQEDVFLHKLVIGMN